MADVEWIRINTDMFDNPKIKYLRTLPDGNNIILVWVMLLTLAGKCNSNGFIFLTSDIAYTTKMLADALKFEESTIILAMDAFKKLNMISEINNTFLISGWEEHQNADGLEKIREQTRIRVEKFREKQRNLMCNVTSNGDVTHCNAIEEELEEDKDKKKNKKDICALFEHLWKLYPCKKGKGRVSDSDKNIIFDIGIEEMERAIDRYKSDLEKDDWRKPQNGSTFFHSGYIDYLDSNYVPDQKKKTQVKNTFNDFKQNDYNFDEIEKKLLKN